MGPVFRCNKGTLLNRSPGKAFHRCVATLQHRNRVPLFRRSSEATLLRSLSPVVRCSLAAVLPSCNVLWERRATATKEQFNMVS